MKRRSLLQWSLSAGAVISSDVLGDIVAVAPQQSPATWQPLGQVQSVGFSGDGYYLYPDWGTPVLYYIEQSENELLFHYPEQNRVLWRQSVNNSQSGFSARLNVQKTSSTPSQPGIS